METFVNRVSESGIITLDLEKFLPQQEIISFDLKDYLFMGMILKEKDYRTALKETDWSKFENKIIAVHCTADAIVPYWAYMLCTTYLQPVAASVSFGNIDEVRTQFLLQQIEKLNLEDYTDARVVVKGCGEAPVPESAYLCITNKLMPVTKSIMYGEPCSTVPVYKKK